MLTEFEFIRVNPRENQPMVKEWLWRKVSMRQLWLACSGSLCCAFQNTCLCRRNDSLSFTLSSVLTLYKKFLLLLLVLVLVCKMQMSVLWEWAWLRDVKLLSVENYFSQEIYFSTERPLKIQKYGSLNSISNTIRLTHKYQSCLILF